MNLEWMCDVETQIGELEKHEGVSLEKEIVNSLDREREEREWIEFEDNRRWYELYRGKRVKNVKWSIRFSLKNERRWIENIE